MKRFIGVDLHKNSFTVCYMQEGGEYHLKSFGVIPRDMEEFKRTLAKDDEVALESTGNASHFARQIEGYVARIRIINPIQWL
jgi:transposase